MNRKIYFIRGDCDFFVNSNTFSIYNKPCHYCGAKLAEFSVYNNHFSCRQCHPDAFTLYLDNGEKSNYALIAALKNYMRSKKYCFLANETVVLTSASNDYQTYFLERYYIPDYSILKAYGYKIVQSNYYFCKLTPGNVRYLTYLTEEQQTYALRLPHFLLENKTDLQFTDLLSGACNAHNCLLICKIGDYLLMEGTELYIAKYYYIFGDADEKLNLLLFNRSIKESTPEIEYFFAEKLSFLLYKITNTKLLENVLIQQKNEAQAYIEKIIKECSNRSTESAKINGFLHYLSVMLKY